VLVAPPTREGQGRGGERPMKGRHRGGMTLFRRRGRLKKGNHCLSKETGKLIGSAVPLYCSRQQGGKKKAAAQPSDLGEAVTGTISTKKRQWSKEEMGGSYILARRGERVAAAGPCFPFRHEGRGGCRAALSSESFALLANVRGRPPSTNGRSGIRWLAASRKSPCPSERRTQGGGLLTTGREKGKINSNQLRFSSLPGETSFRWFGLKGVSAAGQRHWPAATAIALGMLLVSDPFRLKNRARKWSALRRGEKGPCLARCSAKVP